MFYIFVFTLNKSNNLSLVFNIKKITWLEIYLPEFDIQLIQLTKDLILCSNELYFFGLAQSFHEHVQFILSEIQDIFTWADFWMIKSITISPEIHVENKAIKINFDSILLFRNLFDISYSTNDSAIFNLWYFIFDNSYEFDQIFLLTNSFNLQFFRCEFYLHYDF